MSGTKSRTFPAGPGFSALVHAEAWCRNHGFVHGPTRAATSRVGVHRADHARTFVPRWGRMSSSQRSALSGFMDPEHEQDFHGDGVRLTLRADLIPETEDPGAWT